MLRMKLNVEFNPLAHESETVGCRCFFAPNDEDYEMKMERKVVWAQGFCDLAKINLLILNFIYFIGDIFDDVINIYLDAILCYLGKNCALKNSNWKRHNGTIIVRKGNFQIQQIVSLNFDIGCDIDSKNSQWYEKEKDINNTNV